MLFHNPLDITLGSIVSVDADLIGPWRELRLRGLRDHPEAFVKPAEVFAAESDQSLIDRMEAQAKLGGFVLAARSSAGEMIGTAGLSLEGSGRMSHRGHLWGMYVTPESRRQRVGERLIEELLARAIRIPGLEQVHLGVVTTNTPAVSLYTRMGFTTYGTDPRCIKLGDRAFDEYLMVKRLRGIGGRGPGPAEC